MPEQLYTYRFGSARDAVSRYRLRWKRRVCRVLARGAMNTCAIEFCDNHERLVCSRNALRKETTSANED